MVARRRTASNTWSYRLNPRTKKMDVLCGTVVVASTRDFAAARSIVTKLRYISATGGR